MTRPAAAATVLAVFAMVSLTVPVASEAATASAPSARRPLVLPIPPNQTWYVCQGYNGQVTHDGLPALDLSLSPRSAGPEGCLAGSKYSSAGSVVSSPGAGTARRWPGCCGDDFVCVDLDEGGSVAVGHLDNRVRDGTRVAPGARIGTVAWPDTSNGGYAHVHVQAHPAWGCTDGGAPVAFDVAHGFTWRCTPDLPYSGSPNQYAGLAVQRCPGAGRGGRERLADEAGPGGPEAEAAGASREAARTATLVARILRLIGRLLSRIAAI
jgi:hypothetical protein